MGFLDDVDKWAKDNLPDALTKQGGPLESLGGFALDTGKKIDNVFTGNADREKAEYAKIEAEAKRIHDRDEAEIAKLHADNQHAAQSREESSSTFTVDDSHQGIEDWSVTSDQGLQGSDDSSGSSSEQRAIDAF